MKVILPDLNIAELVLCLLNYTINACHAGVIVNSIIMHIYITLTINISMIYIRSQSSWPKRSVHWLKHYRVHA